MPRWPPGWSGGPAADGGPETMTDRSPEVVWQDSLLPSGERWSVLGQTGATVWFTGLSGSGKSSVAAACERLLVAAGRPAYLLDGDNLRHGLNADLGFAPDDRAENIRRVGELAAMLTHGGMIVMTAFISPYRADRALARRAAGEGFQEIFLDPGLEICEERDPKGLYRRARAGDILEFTGISAPYEAPEVQELVIDTGAQSVEQSDAALVSYIENNFSADGS